ncbi:hypothetical protein [Dyella silvae]|uniref:hypothetical protein n=1 Tax=Dyella silvae TaxID=2994424 RepID=UPI00226467D6|nr:hypothetical protein [Dyella silvae]
MEAIIRRLLIVLTVLGMALGAGISGWAQRQHREEVAASWRMYDIAAAAYKPCKADAKGDLAVEQLCWDIYWKIKLDSDTKRTEADRLRTPFFAGLWIIGCSLFLWPIFFLARWILTGSVRRERKPVGEV